MQTLSMPISRNDAEDVLQAAYASARASLAANHASQARAAAFLWLPDGDALLIDATVSETDVTFGIGPSTSGAIGTMIFDNMTHAVYALISVSLRNVTA